MLGSQIPHMVLEAPPRMIPEQTVIPEQMWPQALPCIPFKFNPMIPRMAQRAGADALHMGGPGFDLWCHWSPSPTRGKLPTKHQAGCDLCSYSSYIGCDPKPKKIPSMIWFSKFAIRNVFSLKKNENILCFQFRVKRLISTTQASLQWLGLQFPPCKEVTIKSSLEKKSFFKSTWSLFCTKTILSASQLCRTSS